MIRRWGYWEDMALLYPVRNDGGEACYNQRMDSSAVKSENFPRNQAYARIWTTRREPFTPAELSDALFGRGFVPSFEPVGGGGAMTEAGLADAKFVPGESGFRVFNLSSGKGDGCLIGIDTATVEDMPDDYLARRAVPRPRLVYIVQAGGPSNSDRNLCENIAEALMMATSGVVQLGGLGTKGNKPSIHSSSWIGAIKAMK